MKKKETEENSFKELRGALDLLTFGAFEQESWKMAVRPKNQNIL